MRKKIYFFIGTEAELIKIFPVMLECQKRNLDIKIIASGQNDIKRSRIFEEFSSLYVDLQLSEEKNIKKSAIGLLRWFTETKRNAVLKIIEKYGREQLDGQRIVVHGDTVSTLMGAMLGKKLNMTVCHVEAGLRSHNIFNPFPEEIDRLLTSRIARMHFAPGRIPTANLRYAKGMVFNTEENTLVDSLVLSMDIPVKNEHVKELENTDYFVFVMHRQENLMKKDYFRSCISNAIELSKRRHCVFILHKPTEIALKDNNIFESLYSDNNFTLLPRVDYFDFMKLLDGAQYVITDGGSNQEELSYLGKPALILRKTTERQEGIGKNALLYGGDINMILNMENMYGKMIQTKQVLEESPSAFTAEILAKE